LDRKERDTVRGAAVGQDNMAQSEDVQKCKQNRNDKQESICKECNAPLPAGGDFQNLHFHPFAWDAAGNTQKNHRAAPA